MQVTLHAAHTLAAIRDEGDLLVRRKTLSGQYGTEPPSRLVVVALHEGEALGGPGRRYAFPGDDFEPPGLAVAAFSGMNEAAVDPHGQWQLRPRTGAGCVRSPVFPQTPLGGQICREHGMGWKLELVETGSASHRIEVVSLGEIVAPASVDDIGLDHDTAQRMLGDIQRAVVALQEAALQAEAARLRRCDPTLRLKDFRRRSIRSLHGTVTLRVPRLVRVGPGGSPPTLLIGSARSTTQFQRLRARLGAWMSFR
ncbi:MAG: hypothetical protein RLO46_13075, partial [Pseudomonadales bacterium]